MNTTATCIDFEKILFDDLTAEKPLRQILEHVRLRTGLNVFVLSCDYRPLLYSADQRHRGRNAAKAEGSSPSRRPITPLHLIRLHRFPKVLLVQIHVLYPPYQ